MRYDFYAYLDRMKYIKRWQLMRSEREENIMEHSQSAVIAHALAVIRNEVYGGKADVLKTVLYAMYHETSEVMTGDLPTPVKYYNRSIHGAYKQLEKSACEKITDMLPEELKKGIAPFVLADEDSEEYRLVKAADRLSAYIKCLEELRSGNSEFSKAKKSIEADLRSAICPRWNIFRKLYPVPLTLDELEGFKREICKTEITT
ncbi:MAG: 5'-deoxynucleotidase [Christensenellaceae bacterium]